MVPRKTIALPDHIGPHHLSNMLAAAGVLFSIEASPAYAINSRLRSRGWTMTSINSELRDSYYEIAIVE